MVWAPPSQYQSAWYAFYVWFVLHHKMRTNLTSRRVYGRCIASLAKVQWEWRCLQDERRAEAPARLRKSRYAYIPRSFGLPKRWKTSSKGGSSLLKSAHDKHCADARHFVELWQLKYSKYTTEFLQALSGKTGARRCSAKYLTGSLAYLARDENIQRSRPKEKRYTQQITIIHPNDLSSLYFYGAYLAHIVRSSPFIYAIDVNIDVMWTFSVWASHAKEREI